MNYYSILVPLPRPRHFPEDPLLDQLVAGYDPAGKGFTLRMQRRNARDLRKGIFGPKGLKTVPDREGGEMQFALPNGWTLRLKYDEVEPGFAGDVAAEFIPPVSSKLGVKRLRKASQVARQEVVQPEQGWAPPNSL
jgi:hypothetical protein